MLLNRKEAPLSASPLAAYLARQAAVRVGDAVLAFRVLTRSEYRQSQRVTAWTNWKI